ncbi:MAG TPA: hypothetical protein VFA81_03735 [Burkholderiales bacterium]|nr:hypothetical protein [Burkholderiales bacterium]
MSLSPARHVVTALALLVVACATPQPLPIGRVIEQGQTGQPPESSIWAMRNAKTTYALRGSDFARLKRVGVSDEVLDYIQQSFIDDVDLLTRYWVLGESVGGCVRCLPTEVDLRNPASPSQIPTSTAYYFDRPQGMPSWYRPYSVRRGTITIEQVLRMAKSGASEGEMIRAIRNANLDHVVGVAGLGTIRTRPLPGLTGSELAYLGQQGVPDAVLDELQTAFLSQFVETERLRYQNLGKSPGGSFN